MSLLSRIVSAAASAASRSRSNSSNKSSSSSSSKSSGVGAGGGAAYYSPSTGYTSNYTGSGSSGSATRPQSGGSSFSGTSSGVGVSGGAAHYSPSTGYNPNYTGNSSSGTASTSSAQGSASGPGYTIGANGIPILNRNPEASRRTSGSANGPDLSRRPGLAGKIAVSNGYTVYYDDLGYASKSVKGAADYATRTDPYAGSGYTSKLFTDQNALSGAEQSAIQNLRAQAQAGQISWDQANSQANAIRSKYGYTVDKQGNVTDLYTQNAVNANRRALGLPDTIKTREDLGVLSNWGIGSRIDPEQIPAGGIFGQDTSGIQQNNADTIAGILQSWGVNPDGSLFEGSYVPSYPQTGGTQSGAQPGTTTAEDYIRQMYEQNLASQLAALQSAYDQNMADSRAQDEQIAQAYMRQRNQAAAQSDLSRLSMNEYAIAHGLNTGTAGQMALSQNAALQGSLANLSAQESQSLADSALTREKLGIGFRDAQTQAKADITGKQAETLYNEFVRQQNLALQQQQQRLQLLQAAQEQANWEKQFAWTQQTDSTTRARELASTLLQAGIMPDSRTLAAAGYTSGNAGSLADYYQNQLELASKQQNLNLLQSQQDLEQGAAKWGYTQRTDSRDYAYTSAMAMIQSGVVPDEQTLAAAGIPLAQAQQMANTYKVQTALENAYTQAQINAKYSAGSSGGARSGSSRSSRSSGGGASGTSYAGIVNNSGGTVSPAVANAIKQAAGVVNGALGTATNTATGAQMASNAVQQALGAVNSAFGSKNTATAPSAADQARLLQIIAPYQSGQGQAEAIDKALSQGKITASQASWLQNQVRWE